MFIKQFIGNQPTDPDFNRMVLPFVDGRDPTIPKLDAPGTIWFAAAEGVSALLPLPNSRAGTTRALLCFIYVRPEHREGGKGTELTQVRIDWARQQGYKVLQVIVGSQDWAKTWADFLVSNFGFKRHTPTSRLMTLELSPVDDDRDVVGFD